MSIVADVGGRIKDLWIADWAVEQHGTQRLAEIIIDKHRTALAAAHDEALRVFDAPEGSRAPQL
ncbi:Uncharacterised protein [Nocardia farcinica]|nr:Uncharacterised protein [Nocardia farcinica]